MPAVGGSEHARHAIPLVADLAKKSGGRVTVLNVREHGVGKFTEWERETPRTRRRSSKG